MRPKQCIIVVDAIFLRFLLVSARVRRLLRANAERRAHNPLTKSTTMMAVACGALVRRRRAPCALAASSTSLLVSERTVNYTLKSFSARSFASVRQEKLADKQKRTERYESSRQRMQKLQTRREGRNVGAKKKEFREWYDKRRIYQEIMDRKARQAGMEWTIQAAAILERLPVVTPDHPQWEVDYFNLKTYLMQFGKEYPEELGFSPGPGPLAITDEELLGAFIIYVL